MCSSDLHHVAVGPGVPDGTYCDVVTSGGGNSTCPSTVVVSGGYVNVNVPSLSAVAIYVGRMA